MLNKFVKSFDSSYTVDQGYAANAEVIYGDTDSVMVKFGVETVAEAMKLGQEAAGKVTEKFIKPIKLEFEKVIKFPGSNKGHFKYTQIRPCLQHVLYLTF